VVVAVEVVALVAGLVIINRVLDVGRFSVVWIAVVGVHFFGLGWSWRDRPLYLVGTVLALLGLAGLVIGAAGGSAALIALVSGVGSGATLFVGVGVGVGAALLGMPSSIGMALVTPTVCRWVEGRWSPTTAPG
jgi:hypothetical protein